MTEKDDGKEESVDNRQMPLQHPTIKLNPGKVPPELHVLIPLAEKWGIGDSKLLNALLRKESLEYLEELIKAVDSVDIVKALYFPPLDEPDSFEADTFRHLLLAAGGASNIIMEAKWREQPLGESEIAKQTYSNEPTLEPKGKE